MKLKKIKSNVVLFTITSIYILLATSTFAQTSYLDTIKSQINHAIQIRDSYSIEKSYNNVRNFIEDTVYINTLDKRIDSLRNLGILDLRRNGYNNTYYSVQNPPLREEYKEIWLDNFKQNVTDSLMKLGHKQPHFYTEQPYILIGKGDMLGLLDKKLNSILPTAYEDITFLTSTYIKVKKEGKFEIYDLALKKWIGPSGIAIDYIPTMKGIFFSIAKTNTNIGLFDSSGNVLIPFADDNKRQYISRLHEDLLLKVDNGNDGEYLADVNGDKLSENYESITSFSSNPQILIGAKLKNKERFYDIFDKYGKLHLKDMTSTGWRIARRFYYNGFNKWQNLYNDEMEVQLNGKKFLKIVELGKIGFAIKVGTNEWEVYDNEKNKICDLIAYDLKWINFDKDKGLISAQYKGHYTLHYPSGIKALPQTIDYVSESLINQKYLLLGNKDSKGIINRNGEWIVPLEWEAILTLDDKESFEATKGQKKQIFKTQ